MRVLVCGGRSFKNYKQLCRVLDLLHEEKPFTTVVQGGSKGADRLATKWADEHGIPHEKYNAEWRRFYNGAGFIPNKQLIKDEKPDLVVAFPGGRGTERMVRQSHNHYVKVLEIESM